MNYLVSLPLCSILLNLEMPLHTGIVCAAGNERSARQVEARISANAVSTVHADAFSYSSVPSLSISQATGAPPFFNGMTNSAVVSGKRTAGMLRDISLSGWTREEAESNQKLFWERYQFEIQYAMIGFQLKVKSFEQEIARNKHLEGLEDDKIAKCDEYLKKIQSLARANRFPVDLDGEIMSKNELQDIRVAYETLRTQTVGRRKQYEDQIQATGTQLILLRSEISKKKTELKTVEAFIQSLDSDSREKTPDFGTVLNGLYAGKTLTEIIDDPSPESVQGTHANAPQKAPIQNISGMLDREKSK